MISRVENPQYIDIILDYLSQDIANCLYIYVDLWKYGLDNPNMKLWIGGSITDIQIVMMKYHDGIQIYSDNTDWNLEEIISKIKILSPERIAGNVPVIKILEKALGSEYSCSYGTVLKRPKTMLYGTATNDKRCVIATIDDIPDIMDLLFTDKEFSQQYDRMELTNQFEERFKSGMGKSMIVRQGKSVIAHVGSFAECDKFAVISGSMVRKDYRKSDLFDTLHIEFDHLISAEEEKDAYFFVMNKKVASLYKRLFVMCTEYGRLVKTKRELNNGHGHIKEYSY